MKFADRLGRRPRRPFHSAIATSFAVEFAALEEILLPQLMASGASNLLLISDERMAAMALSDGSRLPVSLGRDYALHNPPANEGIFHPKIILQIGRDAGRAYVSSANATAAGLGGNAEVAIEIECNGEESSEQELIRAIWRYVDALIPDESSPARDAIRWAVERAPWLKGALGSPLKELDDGTAIAFLHSPSERSIADDFIDFVGGEKVEKLVVISPYWDADLAALTHLSSRLEPGEIIVPLDSTLHEFPTKAPFASKARIVEIGWPSSRFTHAKIYVAMTASGDHVLIGSANCTLAAMGGQNRKGRNAEACIYRRLPRGGATQALGLARWLDADPLELSGLVERDILSEIPLKALDARRPGTFELDQGSLHWRPPANLAQDGVVQLLDRTGAQVGQIAIGAFISAGNRLSASVDSSLQALLHFARVQQDDFISTTAHVAHRQALRSTRREAASGNIARALANFADGSTFELWMHQAFETLVRADSSSESDQTPLRATRSRQIEKKEVSEAEILSYDEFTEARSIGRQGSGQGANSLAGTYSDNIRAFLNLLSGRGESPPAPDDDSWLDVDEESGDTHGDDDIPSEVAAASADVVAVEASPIDLRLYEKHVVAYAEGLECEDEQLGSSDVLRLRYWLLFLLYKARCEELPKGLECSSETRTWPRFIVRILVAFFCGRTPAITRLMVSREYSEMPLDFMECWITALWGLEAIEILMPASPKNRGFLKHIPELKKRITAMLGLTPSELGSDIAMEIRLGLDGSIGQRLGVSLSISSRLPNVA